MVTKKVVIKNSMGLHASTSAMAANTANKFESSIVFENRDGNKCDAKNIMGIMCLVFSGGSTVKIYADGKDEKEAMEALVALLER